MKYISAKINMYTKDAIVVNNNIKKILLHFIFGSLGALMLLYVFFLSSMVVNIIERRSLEADMRSLSNEVQNLELTYLDMSNSVDLPFSYSMGFKEAKTTFATRKSLGFKPNSLDNLKTVQNGL